MRIWREEHEGEMIYLSQKNEQDKKEKKTKQRSELKKSK